MWNVVKRRRLFLGLIIIIPVLLVFITQMTSREMFEATATIQVEFNDAIGANQADIAARNQQRVANEARIYRSRAVAEKVVRTLNLMNEPEFRPEQNLPKELALGPATDKLMQRTTVASSGDSDFIDVTVRSESPELAAKLANQFVDSLSDLRAERRSGRRNRLIEALESERGRLANEVASSDQAVAAFRAKNRMLVGTASAEDYAQINRVAAEAASASSMRAAATARSASAPLIAGAPVTTSSLLDQQQRQFDDLLRKKSALGVQLGARHPELQQVDAQLNEVRQNMDQETARVAAMQQQRDAAQIMREKGLAESEAAAAAARAGDLEGRLSALKSQAFNYVAKSVELGELERKAQVAKEAYLTTAQRLQEVRAQLRLTGVNSMMVSSASIPLVPVSPTPKKATLAAFFGSAMLGLLVIAAMEMLDDRLRTSDQMLRLFNLPTFAMFPRLKDPIEPSTDYNPVTADPESLFAEVARTLAAEVAALQPSGSQTVLVTSPLPGDGKSIVALNLVAAAASMGRRAVIVDLDLRRGGPSVLRSIQTQLSSPDLIDYLTGSAPVRTLLPPVNEPESSREIQTYRPVVLSARLGVPNPASLIREHKIAALLEHLRESFDLIVVNAPAVLAVRDARTLCNLTDSTLMVARWGHTTIEQMRAAMQLLQNRVAGAVFNQVDYVEHARRCYGDSVQFYMNAASYYSGAVPRPEGVIARSREWLRRFNHTSAA